MCNAKIAQLVEHNLAKVGVAGSSPVFRSKDAAVVESVDTQDLKSCDHCDRAGSSPACGTRKTTCHLWQVVFFCKKFMQFKIFYIFVNERSQNGVFYVQSFDNNINGSLIIK